MTLTNSDTAYQLSPLNKTVNRIIIQGKSGNTGVLSIGVASTLKPSTSTGIIKQLAPPNATLIQTFEVTEDESPNGCNPANFWLSSTNGGDIVVWGYDER